MQISYVIRTFQREQSNGTVIPLNVLLDTLELPPKGSNNKRSLKRNTQLERHSVSVNKFQTYK